MWTIGSVLQWTTKHFQDKGIETARLDAEVLLAYVLQKKRIELYTNYAQPLLEEERMLYRECVRKRSARVPVAYITGKKEFYGLEMIVNENVLVPRNETEFLVEQVLLLAKDKKKLSILEIGVGSGALVVAILNKLQEAEAAAVDISAEALNVAQKNAAKHGVLDRLSFFEGDLFYPLRNKDCQVGVLYDVIVSNPPYLSKSEMENMLPELCHEPELALHGGEDGLVFYRRLLAEAGEHLQPEGFLLLEIGASQAKIIIEIACDSDSTMGWQVDKLVQDYAGLDRVLVLKKGVEYGNEVL